MILEPPQPPPRNVYETIDEEYFEDVDENNIEEEQLGARPKNTKSDTIDIRHKIATWYDEASEEIERDLSLDLSVLEEEVDELDSSQIRGPIRFRSNADTILRNFDPMILQQQEFDESYSEENNDDNEFKQVVQDEESSPKKRSENLYVAVPCSSFNSDSQIFDTPPPSSPPPPLPNSEPPVMSGVPVSYENIWIDPGSNRPILNNSTLTKLNTSPPPVPPRRPSFLNRTNDDSAISSSASSSSNDVHALSFGMSSPKSSSMLNLPNLAKFATNIKRKMSESNNVVVVQHPNMNQRRNSMMNSMSTCTNSVRAKTKSGVMYIYQKSKRSFQLKWCTLDHGHLKYFNDKQMAAIPKESIPLASILCLRKHDETASGPQREEVYSFTVSYLENDKKKHREITFGAASLSERDKWLDVIVQSLDYKLTGMNASSRLTWAQLKTGFAGIWHKTWISLELSSSSPRLKYIEDFELTHDVDMKKVKNLTLVREVKNLSTPLSHNLPVLVMDCLDRSLYIQSPSKKEGQALKEAIERVAFSNSNKLDDLQLTSEDIPVIVDKCISFVYSHGVMTEGIYR